MPSFDNIQINITPQQETQKVLAHSASSGTLHLKDNDRQMSDTSSTSTPHRIQSRSSRFFNRIRKMARGHNSFVFTDYSPKRFAHMRSLSGITTESYLESFQQTTMPQFSEGKSGAFLYFSSDYKYIVKTTTAVEFEKLLQILPEYEAYFDKEHKKHRSPLLTRYLGAHRIVMYDIPLYFVVMKNVCPSVDEKYDLKGSWVNRHGSKLNKDFKSTRPKKNYQVVRDSLQQSDESSPEHSQRLTKLIETKSKEKTPLFLDNDVQKSFMIHHEDAERIAKQINRDICLLESEFGFILFEFRSFKFVFCCCFVLGRRFWFDGLQFVDWGSS
jgi:hypothetical protein